MLADAVDWQIHASYPIRAQGVKCLYLDGHRKQSAATAQVEVDAAVEQRPGHGPGERQAGPVQCMQEVDPAVLAPVADVGPPGLEVVVVGARRDLEETLLAR